MTLAIEFALALLCAALLFCLHRAFFWRFTAPVHNTPVFAVIPAVGDGEDLEQTLRHLQWLRSEKLTRFTILVVDAGLTPQGLDTIRALGNKDPTLLFCPAEEATLILQRKDDHGYFSL